MAFSFRAGINWCHDFPKLARESGFYFNMHRTHVRVDWNRISTIDIDRVIRERDFFTIDDNINNVVDYHLETEYDVKILDPNFVKLFRLAQLSVEYLLYCKQYLDHSVIILKDELRSKLEENTKLKNELSVFEDNMKELRKKFRDKYKLIEKRFSDSHGEIHKCPFCSKTFSADVFVNSHITRRHSNVSQLSMTSPVHEQYKAEAEKLHDEIKSLKERLNETERVVRSESMKLSDSIESSKDKYNAMKNDDLERSENAKERRLEEEHKKYREEINHLTTMLFSEIRSLKRDENSSNQKESGEENMKELLKQRDNEINRLRDQLRQLCMKKSTSDMEIIQTKLNAQEDYWQKKLEQLECQHRHDIETLYTQLKLTQASADFVKSDYLNKIKEWEESKSGQVEISADSPPSIAELKKLPDRSRIIGSEHHRKSICDRRIDTKDPINSGINGDNCGEIVIENVDEISDIDLTNTETPVSKFHRIMVGTMESVDHPAEISAKENNTRKNIHTVKLRRGNFQKPSNQQERKNGGQSDERLKVTPRKSSLQHNMNRNSHKKNVTDVGNANKMDVSSSESDESDSKSESTESDRLSRLNDVDDNTSSGEETIQASENNVQLQTNVRMKNKEELKVEIQEALEQKLRDLGVDPEWHQIPDATYRSLSNTVEYHRSINLKKYPKFASLRRAIMKQIADSVSKYTNDNEHSSVHDTVTISPPGNLLTNVKSKYFKASGNRNDYESHTPKLKSQISSSNDKSVTNKFNIELLPKKINQLEFREMKFSMVGQSQQQRSQMNRDADSLLSSSIHDRYTLNPSRLTTKSMESVEMKHLSHSYESIKDYMQDDSYSLRKIDSPLNMSGPITTSTPQRDYVNISSSHKTIAAEASSRLPNSEEVLNPLNSPKHNKSVLKSTTGSTGSLVKKKVLFDLQTNENFFDTVKPHDFHTHREQINDKESESGSDVEISNINAAKSGGLVVNGPTNTDNIVLRTAQSEKIAEISRKIETQLNTIRHKPLGSIEAMFAKRSHTESEKDITGKPSEHPKGIFRNDESELGMTAPVTKFPQPTPRITKPIDPLVPSNYKYDTKDSNLDMEIEELLRED